MGSYTSWTIHSHLHTLGGEGDTSDNTCVNIVFIHSELLRHTRLWASARTHSNQYVCTYTVPHSIYQFILDTQAWVHAVRVFSTHAFVRSLPLSLPHRDRVSIPHSLSPSILYNFSPMTLSSCPQPPSLFVVETCVHVSILIHIHGQAKYHKMRMERFLATLDHQLK